MVVRFEKVVGSPPAALTPDTIYAVRRGTGVDLHITDNTGTVAHKLNEKGIPSGYTADVFGGVLYFGYGSYDGGGWAVLRNEAGALGVADGATNGDAALPARASWPDLNYIGY